MAQIKTAAAFLADLRNFLKAFTQGTDISENAVLLDLSLRPASVAGELISTEIVKAANLQLIDNLSGVDLNNEGTYNFGSPRKIGTKAIGTVTFSTSNEPSNDIVIPVGTIITTSRTILIAPIRFTTVESKTMFYATRASYYDPSTGAWTIDLNVEALLEGADCNVPANSINTFQTKISGISAVYNKDATYQGSGVETDSQFRSRLKERVMGRELGQRSGIKSFVLKLFAFQDAYVITVNDSDCERIEGTDIFVIDNSITDSIEAHTFYTGVEDYVLNDQPSLTINSVESLARGVLSVDTDYEFIRDSGTNRLSTRAGDLIRILPAAALPNLDTLTISHIYSGDITVAQEELKKPINNLISADPLLKRGIMYLVDVTARITFFASADLSIERTKIQSALISYFGALTLGQDVQSSDLVVVIQRGYGDFPIRTVDSVEIGSFSATSLLDSNVITPVNGNLSIPPTSYARFGSLSFA